MNKKLYLVKPDNYDKLVDDKEMIDGSVIIIVISDIEFIDDDTFRISNNDIQLDNKDVFYYDGAWDGYYNRVLINQDYTYYCMDGSHSE